MKINSEDLNLIRKFEGIMQRGYYASGQEVASLYNRVLEKHVNPSNCGACIRRQIQELVEAANRFERMIELEKKEDPVTIPQEENKAVRNKKNKK